jgi:hypothetical protein
MQNDVEIMRVWQGNSFQAVLYVFRNGIHERMLNVTEPHISIGKKWRQMTEEEVMEYECPALSSGAKFFTYHIKGETDESVKDCIE